MVGEGEVEGINYGGFRDDRGVVIIKRSVDLVVARESVGGSEFSTRENFSDDVEVLQEKRPLGLSTREFAGIF